MIDVENETLISLKEAIPLFPGCKKLSMPTVYRWFQHGIRGVKLETVMIGRHRFTSREAITRFIVAQNATAEETDASSASPSQREAMAKSAQVALQKAGC